MSQTKPSDLFITVIKERVPEKLSSSNFHEMAETLSSPPSTTKQQDHLPQEQQVAKSVHPCKLLQAALIAILKCLGLEGGALHTATPGENNESKDIVDEEEADSIEDPSLLTGKVQGRAVSSALDPPSEETDPPAADDPPPSTVVL